MSYASLYRCVNDSELQQRVAAGAMKESLANATLGATPFGLQLIRFPNLAVTVFMWPIAVDNETDYAYAVETNNAAPGSAAVITDAAIGAGLQAHWPAEAWAGMPL